MNAETEIGQRERHERLERLRETYQEVLAATKHEDDKVGRFLTAIAFLLAGALIFVRPEVLSVRYDLDGSHVPLPALALAVFLVTVTLTVLSYVLAIGTPLTVPPYPRRSPQQEADAAQRERASHLFFRNIAWETPDTWRAQWDLDGAALEVRLTEEYRNESLNIARRVSNKRNRSLEASALFACALLFFAGAVALSIHVLSDPMEAAPALLPDGQGHGVAQGAEPVLTWSLPLRLGIGSGLVLFSGLLIYQQRRIAQFRIDPEEDRPRGWWAMTSGYGLFILGVLLPSGWTGPGPWLAVALTTLGALLAAWGYLAIRKPRQDGAHSQGRPSDPAEAAPRAARWTTERLLVVGLAVVFGAVAAAGIVLRAVPAQLVVAVAATLSPLLGTVVGSFTEGRRRKRYVQRVQQASNGYPDGTGSEGT